MCRLDSIEGEDDPLQELSDELLAEMARSSEQALSILYRRHVDRMARYVARHIRSRHDSEDVTSQVFLAMVRGLPKWKRNQVPFIAWLYRLATNAIYSWMRRQRFRKWIGLSNDPSTAIEPLDEIEEVVFALQQIPEPYQQTLTLYYLEQLSITTVAQVLGIAEGTVKSRLTRGRSLLKELLESRHK